MNTQSINQLQQEEITSLHTEWVIPNDTREKLTSHYLLYWDRIYFNNYLPYYCPNSCMKRAMTHNGSRYVVSGFESFPGEWEKGLEQSSRVSLSFRAFKDSNGKIHGVVLVKAALYKEIL